MMFSKELKSSIIDDAMFGNITNQLETDTPAQLAIAEHQIRLEKWISSKKIKKFKQLGDVADCVKNLEIPDSWEYVQLGQICAVMGGKRIPAGSKLTTTNTGYIYIRVTDMQNGTIDMGDLHFATDTDFAKISKYIIESKDVYITVAGTIGRVGTIPEELSGANLTENADRLVFEEINKEWLVMILSSKYVQNQISEFTTKVGQPKLSIENIRRIYFPLPPLEEQQRIVDRVDELMAKVDELEKIEKELDSLESGFADELKASIIEAGFSGRLFNDGEISAVSEIKNELERLMNSKAFKVHKYQNDTLDDEPYDIPENWKWGYLGTTTTYAQTKVKASPEFLKEDHWLLDMEDIEKETGKVNQKKRTTSQKFKGEKLRFEAGDLLYSKLRPYLKKVLIADEDGACTSELVPVKPLNGLLPEYLCWYLRSPFVTRIANKESYGTKMPRVGVATMINIPVPIPSKNCQKHIVDKLNLVISRIEELQSLAKH